MSKKKWWKSRTLWVNAIALGSVFLSKAFGIELTAGQIAVGMTLLNALMRLITGSGLEA